MFAAFGGAPTICRGDIAVQKIFISYRRNDTAVFTGRLYDRLIDYYGADLVFLDIDSIPGAVDFREVVKSHIKKCGVFLAIIGKQWEGASDSVRRIDGPEDHVRIEIEQAFADNKPTIPVYVDDKSPFNATDLPISLQRLAYANACTVESGRDFNHHVQRLRGEINKILFPSRGRFLAHATARFLRRNSTALGLCIVFAIVAFALRAPIGRFLLPRSGLHATMEAADPQGFSNGERGTYQIARGLPNRTALVSETDLVKTIRQSHQTFDAFALTGSAFFNNSEALKDALQHGVKFRIVLLDHSPENRANVEAYFSHSGTKSTGVKWSVDNARLAIESLRRFQKESQSEQEKGNLDVRAWRGSYLNSFWVRDGYAPDNALAHMEMTYYGDANLNPSIRFGSLSPKMIASLQEQFEYIWSKSVPIDAAMEK
jgi:hypothetical protein